MRARAKLLVLLALAGPIAACGGDADDQPPDPSGPSASAGSGASGTRGDAAYDTDDAPDDPELVYLSPIEHLTRASLALRGLRPSVDELTAVKDDPRYVEAIVDWYLTTPEFGRAMRELHAESLLIGVDPVIFPAGFPAIGPLAGRELQSLNQSIIEAPLRLIEHVIASDAPYSEIVTADYTLADEVVATVFGLPYEAGGESWQVTRYEDEARRSAGILADSFLFTRHSTTYSNKSRGRANLVSRALLCYDFLSRELPVDSGIDLADPEAVAHAVKENEACASCHDDLDPLASHFASFYPIFVPSDLERYPFSVHAPAFRQVFSASEPGYFGKPSDSLASLGKSIAEDPRFSSCAARRFYSFFARVDLDDVPQALGLELQSALVESQMNAKALAKAVVLSDAFRASHALHDAKAETLVGLKLVRPYQLASMIEGLTGYRFRTNLPVELGENPGKVGEIDLMTDAFFGFEVLAGGMDGNSVTRASTTSSATVALSLEALAARAADAVVEADFGTRDRGKRRLLRLVDEDDDSADEVRAQLAELQLRLYGAFVAPDDAGIDDALELHRAAREASNGDGSRAWKLTLLALLQDPRILHY